MLGKTLDVIISLFWGNQVTENNMASILIFMVKYL